MAFIHRLTCRIAHGTDHYFTGTLIWRTPTVTTGDVTKAIRYARVYCFSSHYECCYL